MNKDIFKELFSERNEFGIYIESRSQGKEGGYVVWDNNCIIWEGTQYRMALRIAKNILKEKKECGNADN